MARIKQVRKDDGTLVPFRERKIVESTLMALRAAGCDDVRLAEDLSGAVILFLEKNYSQQPPRLEDVETMLLKVLRETGHADAAVHFESLQRRRRELEAELQVVRSLRATGEEVLLEDAPTALPWDRELLVSDLESSGRVPAGLAEEVGGAVEGLLIRSGLRMVSTRLLAELRDSELKRRGFEPLESASDRIEVRRAEVEACLAEVAGSGRSLESLVAGRVLEPWSLKTIHSPQTVRAHEEGRLHLSGLDDPFRVERLVLPCDLAVPDPTRFAADEGLDWLLELAAMLQRLSPHVRSEIALPDLTLALAQRFTATDSTRLIRRLLTILDARDAFDRPLAPRARLSVPLGFPKGSAPEVATFIDALLVELEKKDAGHDTPVDLVYEPSFEALPDEVVQRAIAVARARPGARLGIAREGDHSLEPNLQTPHPLCVSLSRLALNLPLALIDVFGGSLSEALKDLEVVIERARAAFLDCYWAQRRAPDAGLQALLMALGGPDRLSIPAQRQEVDLEVWGLQHALELLVRREVIGRPGRPEAAARILELLDYFLLEEAEGVSFRVRLGGPKDRAVRARFLGALDAWSVHFGQPEIRELLEENTRERRHELTLPVVLPLLGGGNAKLLDASFATRVGPGLALPYSAFEHEAGPDLLARLAAETKLGLLSLEPGSPGDGVFELQGELFS